MTRRKYPLRPGAATSAAVRVLGFAVLISAFVAPTVACKSAAEIRAEQKQALDEPSQPEILYQAILDVYSAKKLEIDLASKRHLTVSSRFENLSASLRRRTISRVIVLSNGIALKVRSQYQTLEPNGADSMWVDADESYAQRSSTDENEVGEAIQRRFHELK